MSGSKLLPTPLESLFLGLCPLTSVGKILGNNNGPDFKVFVEEDSDVVLPGFPINKEDVSGKIFVWWKDGRKVFKYDSGIDSNNGLADQDQQFKDRVTLFYDQLKNGIASIKIRNVTMTDSGIYNISFPSLQPSQTFTVLLVVERILRDRSGEIPENTSSVPENTSSVPENPSSVPENPSSVPENPSSVPDNTSSVPDNTSSVPEKPREDGSTKVDFGWLFGGIVIGVAVVAAVLVGLKATKGITFTCNRGAAPDPTSSSTDPTNDIPLLEVGVPGEHQHQNGSASV